MVRKTLRPVSSYTQVTGVIRVGLACCFLGLAAVAFIGAAALPGGIYEPLGPGAFPQAVACAVALLALPLLFLRPAPPDTDAQAPDSRQDLALFSLVLTALYVLLLTFDLDFRPATFAYAMMLSLLFSGDWRRGRNWVIAIGLALVLGFGVHFLMTDVFVVDMPG
ncbi:hypothetical protein DXV76_00885 [Rhodobacteraceae bacterium CCMM004]|nr:hypothetical protein DXV76_00885 [Rhodobacteraceae bacterium CCMM004]